MSRIGKKPIPVPSDVKVVLKDHEVKVSGPKGELTWAYPATIEVEFDVSENMIRVSRQDDAKQNRALHGLARALVANMVQGVVSPFVKELEIQGVGYRAEMAGSTLKLQLGFSHPVEIPVPKGLEVKVDRNVIVRIEGIDRRQVGQFAADLRAIRPPEPYKGKGIRYADEHVRRKAGKAATGAGG